MQTGKNKKIGVVIMFLGLTLCIFFLWYFKFDGVKIDFTNKLVLLKSLVPIFSLILGLYFGLYFYGGKRIANQIGGGIIIFVIIGYLLGLIRFLAH